MATIPEENELPIPPLPPLPQSNNYIFENPKEESSSNNSYDITDKKKAGRRWPEPREFTKEEAQLVAHQKERDRGCEIRHDELNWMQEAKQLNMILCLDQKDDDPADNDDDVREKCKVVEIPKHNIFSCDISRKPLGRRPRRVFTQEEAKVFAAQILQKKRGRPRRR